jgi:pyruvate/2-oxoacid:ferredoxin oxidoreductase beta subunit
LLDIVKQDAQALNRRGKKRVEKIANAARVSFVERSLLQDHNQFLSKTNSEAKARQSAKSLVLGMAKVMSYEGLEHTQAKRAAKDEVAASKIERGRKRKDAAPDASAPQPKRKVAQKNENQKPWKAPVAQIFAGEWY